MSKEALIDWIRSQQTTLEEIVVSAAKDYENQHSAKRIFSFDARKTGEELWLLSRGEDLCYDRPSIGFKYSLWYHPKRINTFLKYFTNLIYDARNENSIEIFDLGAGTGAVLWAVGIIKEGMRVLNLPCPRIRVINVDTSPFMLIYNHGYLWKSFAQRFPAMADIASDTDYRLNSWTSMEDESLTNIWLCASYLFDHSDTSAQISAEFKKIVEEHRPNKILLLTSQRKRIFCDAIVSLLSPLNYSINAQILNSPVFSGPLLSIYNYRNNLSLKYNLNLRGTPSWNIDSLYGQVLENRLPQLGLGFKDLNLYKGPERNRKKIRLTDAQKEAAELSVRPTIIIGPAGCGKSVVLTQKIKNIVESSSQGPQYNPGQRILVTTFNKGLVRHLGDWIEQLLEVGKFERYFPGGHAADQSYFTFTNSTKPNIQVMHFDVLPTRIGELPIHPVEDGGNIEDYHRNIMSQCVKDYISTKTLDQRAYSKILDADFLLEEYQRVIYGNLCTCYNSAKDKDIKYATTQRTGRGNNPQLRYKSLRRRIVWDIITLYLRHLNSHNKESFIIRRHRFLKKMIRHGCENKFNHIIVDEFQDCTNADYEIFYHLLDDPNNLTLAGDIAQAIHLGASVHIPKTDEQGNFIKKKLEGSFRLPFRVSECIKPLSETLKNKFGEREGLAINVINPYTGAPPGARPIFIYAENTAVAANKISEIYADYAKALKLDKISIFEIDMPLVSALRANRIQTEAEIILRAKGLEKTCVVWSSRIEIDTQNEIAEFVYTILTRTVSLLIILVFPETKQEYRTIVKQLVTNRLIFWDEDSENYYTTNILSGGNNSIDSDDEDDSDDESDEGDSNLDDLI